MSGCQIAARMPNLAGLDNDDAVHNRSTFYIFCSTFYICDTVQKVRQTPISAGIACLNVSNSVSVQQA